MTGKEQTVVQEVLEVIPAVMRVIRKEFRSRRDPELTLPEFRGMLHINRSPGCALNEVAEYIGLEAPAASKLVDHLVQRGLVRRQEDASDRRRVKLSIPPKGKQRIEAAVEHTRLFLAKRLAPLSSTERQTLLDTMQILKAAFAGEANRPKEKEAHPSS